jgi:hypothetical protein
MLGYETTAISFVTGFGWDTLYYSLSFARQESSGNTAVQVSKVT